MPKGLMYIISNHEEPINFFALLKNLTFKLLVAICKVTTNILQDIFVNYRLKFILYAFENSIIPLAAVH